MSGLLDWGMNALAGAGREVPPALLGMPVDLAAMAMRPLGYQQSAPIMGSEWIKRSLDRFGLLPPTNDTPAAVIGGLLGQVATPGFGSGEASAATGLLGAFAGKTSRSVIDLALPGWQRSKGTMSIYTNPTKSDLVKMSKDDSIRVLKNPETGDVFAWPSNEALHIDIANRLNLPFKTRTDLQSNSFIFDQNQIKSGSDEVMSALGLKK